MRAEQTAYVITPGGVRRGRIEPTNVDRSTERVREGRIQFRVQIENKGAEHVGHYQRARWYDAACVFEREAEASRVAKAARERAIRSGHPRYLQRPIDQIVVMMAVAMPAIGAEGRADG